VAGRTYSLCDTPVRLLLTLLNPRVKSKVVYEKGCLKNGGPSSKARRPMCQTVK